MSKTLLYLPGLLGYHGPSPVLAGLEADGWTVVVPSLPGFDGQPGFEPRDEHLDWIATYWDAIDAAGFTGGPVIGASVGGLFAAELAALRPELVTSLVLINPFGIADADHVGFNLYGTPLGERQAHLFAKGVPECFATRFADLGPEEAPVAVYLSEVAAANILWPLGDRGVAKRLYRIGVPRLTLWGELDEILPVSGAKAWGSISVVAGAGHLAEWDAPDEVLAAVRTFLAG